MGQADAGANSSETEFTVSQKEVTKGAQRRKELMLSGGIWEVEEGAWKDALRNPGRRNSMVKDWEVRKRLARSENGV